MTQKKWKNNTDVFPNVSNFYFSQQQIEIKMAILKLHIIKVINYLD